MFIFFEYTLKFGSPDWFDFIYIPRFIYVMSIILYSSEFLKKGTTLLGKHSTNIWLINPFLYRIYFKDIIYSPQLSILVLIWIMILCILVSIIINKIYIYSKY